jgi:iron complex transport system substrate-binding protein
LFVHHFVNAGIERNATSGGETATESGQSAAAKTTSTGDEAATRTYESDKGTITLLI